MNKIILFVFVSVLFFSCKKEEQSKPEEHITYTHWYKTRSGSLDTLFSVYFPNTFSPNGNGQNDNFSPVGNFTGNYFNFRIFNRDGNVIFHSDNKNFSRWDGKIAYSYIAPIGKYAYKLNISDGLGDLHEYKGLVTLYK